MKVSKLLLERKKKIKVQIKYSDLYIYLVWGSDIADNQVNNSKKTKEKIKLYKIKGILDRYYYDIT